MTFYELINKLKGNETGVHALLQLWINDITSGTFERSYFSIYGFIWGLYHTNYITENDKDLLLEELVNMS